MIIGSLANSPVYFPTSKGQSFWIVKAFDMLRAIAQEARS